MTAMATGTAVAPAEEAILGTTTAILVVRPRHQTSECPLGTETLGFHRAHLHLRTMATAVIELLVEVAEEIVRTSIRISPVMIGTLQDETIGGGTTGETVEAQGTGGGGIMMTAQGAIARAAEVGHLCRQETAIGTGTGTGTEIGHLAMVHRILDRFRVAEARSRDTDVIPVGREVGIPNGAPGARGRMSNPDRGLAVMSRGLRGGGGLGGSTSRAGRQSNPAPVANRRRIPLYSPDRPYSVD